MSRVINGGLIKSTNGLGATTIAGTAYRGFCAVNGYLAALRFASPNTTIDFLDLTNPKAPTIALSYALASFGSTTTDMYFFSALDQLILTANDANGTFAIVDTSALPVSASHITSAYNTITGSGANYASHRLHSEDGITAFIHYTLSGFGNAIESIDLSTLTLIDSGAVSTNRVRGRGAFIGSGYLLISNEAGFAVIYREDISNPAAMPTDADLAWSSGSTLNGTVAILLLDGTDLYVYQFSTSAFSGPSALHVLDVSTPSVVPYPVISSTVLTTTGQNARVPGMHKVGDLLFLPRKSTGNLKIMDVSNPASPTVAYDVWINNAFSFAANMFNHTALMSGHIYIPSCSTVGYVIVDTSVY